MNKMEGLLMDNRSVIAKIFQYYCASGDGSSISTMSTWDYWSFLKDIRVSSVAGGSGTSCIRSSNAHFACDWRSWLPRALETRSRLAWTSSLQSATSALGCPMRTRTTLTSELGWAHAEGAAL